MNVNKTPAVNSSDYLPSYIQAKANLCFVFCIVFVCFVDLPSLRITFELGQNEKLPTKQRARG